MILDTNALSAWAEGSATVEACLRSAERLVVPSIVLGESCLFFAQLRSTHPVLELSLFPNQRLRTHNYLTSDPLKNLSHKTPAQFTAY